MKWGKTPLEGGRGGGVCENPVRFFLNDGPLKTVDYMWVNICCMLDWIIRFCHKTSDMHLLGIMSKRSLQISNHH